MPSQTFYRLKPQRRERLVEQAFEVFSAGRYEDVSVRTLIVAMGLTTGSFYRYFVSKEELYIYLVDEMLVKFWSTLKAEPTTVLSHVPLEEIGLRVPSQSRFWHSFFASSADIRQKYYFRVEGNALYARFYRSLERLPEARRHSEEMVGFVAFLLNTLNFIITAYREIRGLAYDDDVMFPEMRDMILSGFCAMAQRAEPKSKRTLP